MPVKRYAFVVGGPERLAVSWKGLWKQLCVRLDGQPILIFPDEEALSKGGTITLPEGSQLSIKLVQNQLLGPELTLTRNGNPLPEYSAHFETRVKVASAFLLFAAFANIVLAVISRMGEEHSLLRYGISGVICAVLAFFVRRRSLIALSIAIALCVVTTVLTIAAAALPPDSGTAIIIVGRTYIIVVLIRAFQAIRQLEAVQHQRPAGNGVLDV